MQVDRHGSLFLSAAGCSSFLSRSLFLFRLCVLLFFDAKVRQYVIKNLPHNRGCDRSAIIDSLRVVDNTHSQNLRIFGRSKANKGRNIFVGASWQSLGRGRLSSDTVSLDIGVFPGSD